MKRHKHKDCDDRASERVTWTSENAILMSTSGRRAEGRGREGEEYQAAYQTESTLTSAEARH